jgi:hypothetical protein
MTTARVTIKKPADPFATAIDARRHRFSRKWRLPMPERVEPAAAQTSCESDPYGENALRRAINYLLGR